VFQNEMIEIFKQMIGHSTHPLSSQAPTSQAPLIKVKPKYVISVILEFLRTLLENQIPQQPSQQTLLVKYILVTKDTQMLHSLLQYHVLADSLELARILVTLGSRETMTDEESHYEPAYQLGLDMLKKLKSNEEVVYALLQEGLVMRALDYGVEAEAKGLKTSLFLQHVERLKTEGLRIKADFVLRRIKDLKRADEARRLEPGFKALLIDE